jgi:1,4-dihydroxy-2-naphthoate octaprenyltransferase
MATIQIWLEATRPKTLPAAVCPVMVGSSMAYHDGLFHWIPSLICLCFALLIQIGTNFANDYLDGVKGTDTEARIGPRRAVAFGSVRPLAMRRAALTVLTFAFILGLSLIFYGGWWMLLIGASSVICAWLYTGGPYPLAYNGLGDLFVILFFGLIAVGCTYFVQALQITVDALLLGLACGLVINNILVINNYRDLEEDTLASKRTMVVTMGRRFAQIQYLGSTVLAAAILLVLAWEQHAFWLGLAGVPLSYGVVIGARLHRLSTADEFLGALKASGVIVAAFGVLVSVGMLV